jgi:hypothetical protein
MSASSAERQKFRRLVRSRVAETAQACARNRAKSALAQSSLNLIVASELIKSGSAFAIRLGADEDGIAHLARGRYDDAVALSRTLATGSL